MSELTNFPHSKTQSLSRRRLEGLITGGQPVKTIIQVILADRWGMNHLVCGMGDELKVSAGSTHSFVKFCCLHRRFDVLKAVFESAEVQARMRDAANLPMLEALFSKAVVSSYIGPHRTKSELMPSGMSWAQAAARHALPEMLDYALNNIDSTTRFAFSEGDVYASVFLSLINGALDTELGGDQIANEHALECSRVLMQHNPTRGASATESLAASILAATPSSSQQNITAQKIIYDHLAAGRISWGSGVETGALPGRTMIDAAVHSQNAPFAMAIVQHRHMDPSFSSEIEAIQSVYSEPGSIELARETMTQYRSLLMLGTIEALRNRPCESPEGPGNHQVHSPTRQRRVRLV